MLSIRFEPCVVYTEAKLHQLYCPKKSMSFSERSIFIDHATKRLLYFSRLSYLFRWSTTAFFFSPVILLIWVLLKPILNNA